jgi:hypothetical protein
MKNEAGYYTESKEKGTFYMQSNDGKITEIGRILHGNTLLKYVTEGKTEETVRRKRRRKQLLDDIRKREENIIPMRELNALCEELDLKAVDSSQDRPCNEGRQIMWSRRQLLRWLKDELSSEHAQR